MIQDRIAIQCQIDDFSRLRAELVIQKLRLREPNTHFTLTSNSIESADFYLTSGQHLTNDQLLRVIATTERSDCRLIVLLKKGSLKDTSLSLTLATDSFGEIDGLVTFFSWAIPGAKNIRLSKNATGSSIFRTLTDFRNSNSSGLVFALADLNLLIAPEHSNNEIRDLAEKVLRESLKIIVPLTVCQPVAGHGITALLSDSDNSELLDLARSLHDPSVFSTLQVEKQLPDNASKTTIIGRPFGQIVFKQGDNQTSSVELKTNTHPIPRAESVDNIWPAGDDKALSANRTRLTVPDGLLKCCGLLISRAEALPENWLPDKNQPVWTAGIKSWRKLAERGVLVNGCSENLGENELNYVKHLFPEAPRWVKLSHSAGFPSNDKDLVATYQLDLEMPAEKLSNKTHFFWSSASRFKQAVKVCPQILEAWHACGPGNSFELLVQDLPNPERLGVFLSYSEFLETVKPLAE